MLIFEEKLTFYGLLNFVLLVKHISSSVETVFVKYNFVNVFT